MNFLHKKPESVQRKGQNHKKFHLNQQIVHMVLAKARYICNR